MNTHGGCRAHARRKFVVNPKDEQAVKMVLRMDALFAIDRDAKQRGVSGDERQALRREYADAWVATRRIFIVRQAGSPNPAIATPEPSTSIRSRLVLIRLKDLNPNALGLLRSGPASLMGQFDRAPL